jgi:hypothetical protein
MAEKLRSILKRTSWSSVLKAAVFAVAWWALPFWLFLLIALYLYFIPIQGSLKVWVPFFVLLLLCLVTAPDILIVLIFGAIFFFILLVKDLLIIDRRFAYEVLVLVLSYLVVREFFLVSGGSLGGHALVYGVLAAWVLCIMIASFVKNFSPAVPDDGAKEARAFRRMSNWLVFMLAWQLLLVGLFLPLDFLYQSAIVFLVAVILIDLLPQYVFGELSRTKVLATGTVLFALLTIVLASARWVL